MEFLLHKSNAILYGSHKDFLNTHPSNRYCINTHASIFSHNFSFIYTMVSTFPPWPAVLSDHIIYATDKRNVYLTINTSIV